MDVKNGYEAKLYYKVGGLSGGGTWTELTLVRDATLNMPKGEGDVTTRGSGGYKQTKGGLRDVSIEFELLADTDDAGFDAIQTAYQDNTTIAIAAMNGAIATGEGLQVDCEIFDFSRSEPLEGPQTVTVVAKPTHSDTAPSYVDNAAT